MLHPMFCDLDKPVYLYHRTTTHRTTTHRTTAKRGSSESATAGIRVPEARQAAATRNSPGVLMLSSPPPATPFSRLGGHANDPGGGAGSKSLAMYSPDAHKHEVSLDSDQSVGELARIASSVPVSIPMPSHVLPRWNADRGDVAPVELDDDQATKDPSPAFMFQFDDVPFVPEQVGQELTQRDSAGRECTENQRERADRQWYSTVRIGWQDPGQAADIDGASAWKHKGERELQSLCHSMERRRLYNLRQFNLTVHDHAPASHPESASVPRQTMPFTASQKINFDDVHNCGSSVRLSDIVGGIEGVRGMPPEADRKVAQ